MTGRHGTQVTPEPDERPPIARIPDHTRWISTRGKHPGSVEEVIRTSDRAVFFKRVDTSMLSRAARSKSGTQQITRERWLAMYEPYREADWEAATAPEPEPVATPVEADPIPERAPGHEPWCVRNYRQSACSCGTDPSIDEHDARSQEIEPMTAAHGQRAPSTTDSQIIEQRRALDAAPPAPALPVHVYELKPGAPEPLKLKRFRISLRPRQDVKEVVEHADDLMGALQRAITRYPDYEPVGAMED